MQAVRHPQARTHDHRVRQLDGVVLLFRALGADAVELQRDVLELFARAQRLVDLRRRLIDFLDEGQAQMLALARGQAGLRVLGDLDLVLDRLHQDLSLMPADFAGSFDLALVLSFKREVARHCHGKFLLAVVESECNCKRNWRRAGGSRHASSAGSSA
ncbi:hypothetical protein D3C72_1597190 [compost metagenome]